MTVPIHSCSDGVYLTYSECLRPLNIALTHTPSSSSSPADWAHHLLQITLHGQSSQVLLHQVIALLGELFRVDRGMLLLQPHHSRPGSRLIGWQASPHNASPYWSDSVLDVLEQPIIQTILSHSTPLVIHDTHTIQPGSTPYGWTVEDNQTLANLLAAVATPNSQPGTIPRAILAMAIFRHGQIQGVVMLWRSQPYQWRANEVQLLNHLADPLAIAMSHAQLQQQVEQQSRYQALIDQLTGAIRETSDLTDIFRIASEGIFTALQASRCFVLLMKYPTPLAKHGLSFPGTKVTVAAQYPQACDLPQWKTEDLAQTSRQAPDLDRLDPHVGTWINHQFRLSDCQLCQYVLAHDNQPLVIPELPILNPRTLAVPAVGDRSSVCESIQHTAPMLNLRDMPALILVPLDNQGTVLGYLAVQHHQPCPWQMEELIFVKLIAAQISTAVIQAYTLQQVQALVDERTAHLQRSLDVQAKLYNKTRQQIDQLQHLNQLKDEFLSTMSHELKTPLTSMRLAIQMLRQPDLPSERRNKYLDILERQCLQETNLINDLLALQQLESGHIPLRLQAIDLHALIQDLTQVFTEGFTKKGVSLAVRLPSQPLSLCTDPDSLNRILVELLTNAEKYAATGTIIDLKVQVIDPAMEHENLESSTQPHIEIQVSNRGAGISNDEMPYVFDKFRRGRGVTQQAIPGTGLGLALVKGLVEQLGGAIALTSYPLETVGNDAVQWETCFTIALPQ